MKRPLALALALTAGAALSACGSAGQASRTAAMNGYGSGAVKMVHAHLRPGTDQNTASNLSQIMITRPGVVFTNWTPTGGVLVGVGDVIKLSAIETFLRAQHPVADVTEGPVPTSAPTQEKQ